MGKDARGGGMDLIVRRWYGRPSSPRFTPGRFPCVKSYLRLCRCSV